MLGRLGEWYRSDEGGRAAATRRGNGGVYACELRLGNELQRGANQEGNVKRMAECGGTGLSKRGTERTVRVRRAAAMGVDMMDRLGAGKVAELVNDGTLLRSQQQQEETQCLVHISH